MFHNCRVKGHKEIFSCKTRCHECRKRRAARIQLANREKKKTLKNVSPVVHSCTVDATKSAVESQKVSAAAESKNVVAAAVAVGAATQNPPAAVSAVESEKVSAAAVAAGAATLDSSNEHVTFSRFEQERRERDRLKRSVKHLKMTLSACLASREVTTDIKNAYEVMKKKGVALVTSALTVTQRMTDKMQFLDRISSFWEPIFNGVREDGTTFKRDGKRLHLKYNDEWQKKYPKKQLPRERWQKDVEAAVRKLLKAILSESYASSAILEHTLIKSEMNCVAQPWHYDQAFPDTKCRKAVDGKDCPFVLIIGLEEFSFLDVEIKGKPMRVCLTKGDVLLVRGDCLHRGTEFKYSEHGRTTHLRGHVYVYPKSFDIQRGVTFVNDKYASFLMS